MKTSLKQYLDSLDLTAEEKKLLEPLLANEKVTSAVDKDLAGAQTEISRRFDEAKAEKAKSAEYYQTLTTYKNDVDKQLRDAAKQLEDGKVLTVKMQERLRAKVADGTLDEDDFKDLMSASAAAAAAGASTTAATAASTAAATAAPVAGVSKDDFERFQSQMISYAPLLISIAAKHQRLFGKEIDPAVIESLPMEAAKAKKGLVEFANETFKFGDREKAIQAEARTAEEARIRADERTKVMSEVSNPTHRPAGINHSPVLKFSTPEKAEVDSQLHKTRGVAAAVAAFREHKYGEKESVA